MQISHQCADRLCVKIASALFANRRVDEQMALNDKQVKQIRKPFRITENVFNVQFGHCNLSTTIFFLPSFVPDLSSLCN
jgi:hypothetical protein